MDSSKDAFDKFWMWKKSRTLLRVTVLTNGEPPEVFTGAVILPEEEFLRVSFADHDTRALRVVDFSECSFRVGERVLLAERAEGESFRCEESGKRWGMSELDM
jgi:hypothetical protein